MFFCFQMFLVVVSLTLLAVAQAGKYTVTQEAWFDVEVRDLDGPGQDYTGRFTIALFGETAPMTSMNFAAIAKGYKKGRVCSRTLLHNTRIYQKFFGSNDLMSPSRFNFLFPSYSWHTFSFLLNSKPV